MQPSSDQSSDSDRGRQLRRWGPLIGIVVVLIIVVVVVVVSGGDDGGDDEASGGGPDSSLTSEDLPEGVVPFSVAEAEGTVDEIEWGDRCDTERGQLAYPSFFAAECFAPFDGDNGGETYQGVTANTIKVVYYQTPEVDPIIDFITEGISDDTNPQQQETILGFRDLYEAFHETYGRHVEIEFFEGTGASDDEVAARADAVTIAEDIQPFMVLGGPQLTNAFAEELAAHEVPCIACTPSQPTDFYLENAPYVFGTTANAEQGQYHTAEMIGKQLNGENAEFAGDEELQDQERKFGLVFLEGIENAQDQVDRLEERLAEQDVELSEIVGYQDPVALQGTVSNVITRLKEAGITTVLFAGDPIAPRELTREATAQDYSPEWIVTTSSIGVDVTVFARTYDQEQWSHAFGVSNIIAARGNPENQGSEFLYKWFTGEDPPADDSVLTLSPNLNVLYAVLQGVGPDLTPENFQAALFRGEPTPRAITQPSLSWGDKGIWPDTGYLGIDDATAIWWDAEAVGPDERGDEGPGLWTYVDGGERYLPGEWPDEQLRFFDPEGAVAVYDERPPGEEVPDYPSPG
jgi:hypothetical protein